MQSTKILILFYSRFGANAQMAELIAEGVEQAGAEATLRTVPAISPNNKASEPFQPEHGPIYCQETDLVECDGLILGSPTRFGNMAAPMKYFLDTTGSLWMSGKLAGKPAAVFTSTSSMHGGQESTLLSMMLPLLHHGMILAGLPYTESALGQTQTGGSPYGVSHLAGSRSDLPISDHEKHLCHAMGKRMARLATSIKNFDS